MTLRRLAAIVAILILTSISARADSSTVVLTGAWQKISAASYLDVQVTFGRGARLTTVDYGLSNPNGTTIPPASPAAGQYVGLGEHRCFWMGNSDLYARTDTQAEITITTGVRCGN